MSTATPRARSTASPRAARRARRLRLARGIGRSSAEEERASCPRRRFYWGKTPVILPKPNTVGLALTYTRIAIYDLLPPCGGGPGWGAFLSGTVAERMLWH